MKKNINQILVCLIAYILMSSVYCDGCPIVLHDDPFYRSVQLGDIETVTTLIGDGAQINPDGNEVSPLLYAAAYGHFSIARLLIEKGANVNFKSEKGYTALNLASGWGGYIEVVELLLNNSANINAKGWQGYTALHRSAEFGHSNVVKLLLQKGAKVLLENNSGQTPLDVAREEAKETEGSDHGEVIELLKKHQMIIYIKISSIMCIITFICFAVFKKSQKYKFHITKKCRGRKKPRP